MLTHQIGFSTAVEEIYMPISGQLSDQESVVEGNPEGIHACEQYRKVVTDLQNILKPELEMIETRIIGPTDELMRVIDSIRKASTKRDRKQLDLDRHSGSLAKLEAKKDLSIKDEKTKYTLQNNVEIATQEYDYYNNILKEELPLLFQLEAEFIKPLFLSFYYMQLNIFYTVYTRMEEMKIADFDMSSDVMASFEAKRGNVQEQVEAIGITSFRVGHSKAKLDLSRKPGRNENLVQEAVTAPPPYQSGKTSHYESSPEYIQQQPQGYGDSKGVGYQPHQAPPVQTVEQCTALYEYVPQATGDLAIKPGDVIQIVQRTADVDGWWTGRLSDGQVGIFPGNYVRLG